MAFEGLSSKLQSITNKLRGKTRITEADLKEMLREVKLALLEADVNYMIVKEFISSIQEKALGQDVLKSLTPGQQVIKIVKDENEKLVDFISASEIEKLNVVAFKKQIESGHEVLSIKDKILYNLLYKEVCF